MRTLLVLIVFLGMARAAWNCWNGCNKRTGPCSRCPTTGNGSGKCCRRGWTEGGCKGIEGCSGYHCCELGDCWSACGRRAGPCSACQDSSKACCRKGWSSDPIECGKGAVGCSGYHCCVKQATEEQICGSKIDNNWKLVDIKYDVDRSSVSKNPPKVAGTQNVDNSRGSGSQSVSFNAKETFTKRTSFTHTAGASVSVGTEFSCGVPLLAQGKVSVKVSASYKFSYGTARTESKSTSASYTCAAPPGKKVRCEVLYNEFEASVPYTATWQRKDFPGKCNRTTKGVFKEISAFDMHMNVHESRLVMEVLE